MPDTFAARFKKAWRAFTNQQISAQKGRVGARSYAAAKSSRLTSDWNPSISSADAELVMSLPRMRARARQLVRDSSYAKRARTIVVNNVIGTGIGLQAQVMTSRDQLNERVNDAIEEAWCDWSEAENCHVGGRLAFGSLERANMGQVFDAGEVFIRKHHLAVGRSNVPLTLELIEAERIADQLDTAAFGVQAGNTVRMGIEVDRYFRPIAYYVRANHPSEIRFAEHPGFIERVPAEEIIHLTVVDRWPQTRGEPWLHAAMTRMNDMDGYSEAEIIRARIQATSVGAIETPEDAKSFGDEQEDGTVEMEMEPGVYKRLNPGEKLSAQTPTSPNPALDGFMRYMLREVAAGTGVSYPSLSMDYSQSNYSSSRLALLDDRDLWRFYQAWFICDFRKAIHREWLQAAVLSGAIPAIKAQDYAIDPKKFEAARFKPRGWGWIDPVKEVEAYERAIRDGLTTRTKVISMTGDGLDIDDVNQERAHELEAAAELDLVFDTDPGQQPVKAGLVAKPQPDETNPLNQDEEPDAGAGGSQPQGRNQEPAKRRVFPFRR